MNQSPSLDIKPLKFPSKVTKARDVPDSNTLWGAFKLFFRFPTPRAIAIKMTLTLLIRLWVGQWSVWDLAVIGGILVYWPMQEWFFHMHLLHFKPRRILGITVDPAPSRTHRFHHLNPDILETTFVPIRAIYTLMVVNLIFWSLLMNTWALAWTGIWFFTTTALVYEWVHYLTHTSYKPKTRYGRAVFRNHKLHHYKHEAYWHAFTVPLVDTVFGTNPDPSTVKESKTVRTLGIEG